VVLVARRVDEVAHEVLAPQEAALLPPAALPKRRHEFVAGRVAARAAAAQLLGAPSDHIAILRRDGSDAGRPYAVSRAGAPLPIELSITHADGLALAAAAWTPLGVDLVRIEELSDAFVDEAFAPGELLAWSRCVDGEAERVCTAFAAKEAALKWLGCGMRVPLTSVTVLPSGSALQTGGFLHRTRVRVQARTPARDAQLSAEWVALDGRVLMLLLPM
jgi:4'-phosphopantetheinyl transferase